MIKVAIIGAGSVVFTKNLTGDILSYPAFRNAHFSYMDVDEERLKVGVGLCRRIAKGLGATPKIEGTMDRRKAVEGADFVITTVQVGGFDSTLVDFDIPRRYGVKFTIADTTGPGGIFRALRTYPFFQGLMADMEDVCPKATLLNYSNPMSMNMLGISQMSDIQAVGLCHSVQGTYNQLMRYLGEKAGDTRFVCAGINHMAFYLRMEKDGKDLYPRLFEAMNEEKNYNTNKVRFELMKHLGYFITESSEHNAEYCPFFIPHGSDVINRFDIPIDEYLRRCDGIVNTFEELKSSCNEDAPLEHEKSDEYGSTIIHSMITNTPSVVYGNMVNNGAISNLPDKAIVELPTLVDGTGLRFTQIGELPPQLLGYMMPHVIQHELYARAVAEGRRDHIYHACMNDPLTSAILTMDQVVDMCDEMIAAHGDLLPPLEKSPRGIPFSEKTFSGVPAEEFRQRWEDRKPDENDIIIRDWHVSPASSAPVKIIEADADTLSDKKEINDNGHLIHFSPFQGTIQGFIGLGHYDSNAGYAYAFTELESVHQREATMSLGSTDDTTVWLNGEEVVKFEGSREFKANEDKEKVMIKEGWNKILVRSRLNKSDNAGFAITVPKADF